MGRPNLTQHRKFRRLVRSLGSAITARGALELLWDACYDSGDDYVGTADDIENLVGWQGERGVLTTALAQAGIPEGFGFIEPVPESASGAVAYRVHDLWHHAPDYVAKRRQRELSRQQKAAPERRNGDDRRSAPFGAGWIETPTCQNESARTPAPAPAPAPAPEKISAETSSAPPTRTLLVFPVVGPRAGDWPLTQAQVADWAALFPGLDVLAETRKALAWVKASPRRRKTFAGMERFLVGWLSRANDRGSVDSHAPARRPEASAALECPHTPKCAAPGRWQCIQKTRLEEAKRA